MCIVIAQPVPVSYAKIIEQKIFIQSSQLMRFTISIFLLTTSDIFPPRARGPTFGHSRRLVGAIAARKLSSYGTRAHANATDTRCTLFIHCQSTIASVYRDPKNKTKTKLKISVAGAGSQDRATAAGRRPPCVAPCTTRI
ncbi:hypothetical protein EVAR_59197_1 [Eumeta japonica]|uniref:Uncharacterized protein n=1 Tax=Eumeta variegata TaxID=151549 RepID=A0A4C1Z8P8_EUMVA|nr:hypothetical protein EVAR_59197_1 [Eumeta japonica]